MNITNKVDFNIEKDYPKIRRFVMRVEEVQALYYAWVRKGTRQGLTKDDYFALKDLLYEVEGICTHRDANDKYGEYALSIENLIHCIEESNTILHDIHPKNAEYVQKKDSLLPLILADSSSRGRLKMTGENGYMFLCPYHNEKTASFRLKDFENGFYCFGCGASGNVFSYLQAIQRMEFKDAFSFLQKVYLQKEFSEDDPDIDLITMYQQAIISDEHRYLLDLGRERLKKRNSDFMPKSNVLVDDYYADKYRTIERIKNQELDPYFKHREPIQRLVLPEDAYAQNEEFRERYVKIKKAVDTYHKIWG